MGNRKSKMIIIIILTIILGLIIIVKIKNKSYDVNKKISSYNISDKIEKNKYIDYLKNNIYPEKLRRFVNNNYINFSQYKDTADGNLVIKQLEFNAYKRLFMSMFNKSRTNFDDCPVTEKFKEKFNTNLLEYFNLIASEDCESNCLLNRDKQEITVEVYGNFENTEPTYQNTHHFHYTLDSDGNVDDIIYNQTE